MESAASAPHSRGMHFSPVLAEAVTFDPGLVVALFAGFLLVCLTALVIVVVGIVAGYRSGRHPGRTRAAIAWRTCLAAQALVAVTAVATGADVGIVAGVGAALATSVAANLVGRRTAERS